VKWAQNQSLDEKWATTPKRLRSTGLPQGSMELPGQRSGPQGKETYSQLSSVLASVLQMQ